MEIIDFVKVLIIFRLSCNHVWYNLWCCLHFFWFSRFRLDYSNQGRQSAKIGGFSIPDSLRCRFRFCEFWITDCNFKSALILSVMLQSLRISNFKLKTKGFSFSAQHWCYFLVAKLLYKSKCPSVCLSVRMSVRQV